MMYSDISQDYL